MAKHYRKLPLILPLSLVPALCLAEGSAEIGAVQGLEANSTLKVFVQAGETLEFCSSDDGKQEAPVSCQSNSNGSCSIDANAGDPFPKASEINGCELSKCRSAFPRSNSCGSSSTCAYRLFFEKRHEQGADILLTPPTPKTCTSDDDCAGISLGNQPAECRYEANGLRVTTAGFDPSALPVSPENPKKTCQIAFNVKEDGQGYCTEQNYRNASKHSVTIPAGSEGEWSINFAGEPESRSIISGGSARYFDVTVKGASGAEIKGRLHTDRWWLNAHRQDFGADSAFYVKADVTDKTAHVFKIDFDDVRGFRWQLSSNDLGITSHKRQSYCQHGEPFYYTDRQGTTTLECATDGHRDRQNLDNEKCNTPVVVCEDPLNPDDDGCIVDTANFNSKYQIYLNYPNPAPGIAPTPEITSARFGDSFGSTSISPNGDGNQDTGTFYFTSNVSGTYSVIVDTDHDGEFNGARDWEAAGNVEANVEQKVEWDGKDKDGRPVTLGEQYKFQIQVATGETHFPMVDIESNEKGFIIQKASALGQFESTPMYWDDTKIRNDSVLLNIDDAVVSPSEGSAARRYWVQGASQYWKESQTESTTYDMPMVFDTWVIGEEAIATKVGCALGCDDGGVDYIYVCNPNLDPNCDEKESDRDEDGIPDSTDNCPDTPNTDQADFDNDGIGDACDNCWKTANADQADSNNDGIGDACDPDDDGISSDGILDGNGNVTPGSVDNCPNVKNPEQEDENGDGIGDACEGDADSDGIPDSKDNCPTTENRDQADWNNNGIGDACDDTDSDGIFDNVDNCVTTPNTDQKDTDGDGIGDACDDDIDGDGVLNDDDNCVYVKNPNQEDENENGIGDACETDAALDITGNSPIPFDTFEGCSQNGRSSGMPFLFLLPILALRRRKH